MKQVIFFCSCMLLMHLGKAQTKRIEHRSHNGSHQTFTTHGNSNFGISPKQIQEQQKKADSLRKIQAKQDSISKTKKRGLFTKKRPSKTV
jgi:hypothetical protein